VRDRIPDYLLSPEMQKDTWKIDKVFGADVLAGPELSVTSQPAHD
jgi:hypothetical protein